MCTLSVSNVIYHKFSHGAAFYMLNGKNVNVMLELLLKAVVKKMPKSCCAVGCSNHNMMNPLFIPSLIISVKVNQFIVFM